MAPPQSSQEFIRALKASTDPPVPGGPTKIEIAVEAWSQTSFLVPSKAEVIVDWILSRFLKDRGREQFLSPIQDHRYWKLLARILASSEKTQEHRPIKVWLSSLLQRFPFGSAVALFLNSLETVPPDHGEELIDVASSVVAVIWPLAAQRINTELLQECFGNFLRRFMFDRKLIDNLTKIGLLVTTAYRNSFTNSSNKKKLYLSFLTSHLQTWLYFLNIRGTQPPTVLPVHEAGFETLFNLDVLRQTQESKTENALFTHLRIIQASDRQLVLATIPHLFTRYIHSIKRHQGALYSQGSKKDSGAAMSEVRDAGEIFFIISQEIVNDNDQGVLAWQTRAALLRTANQENILDHNQSEAKAVLNQVVNLALMALDASRKGAKLDSISIAIECLTIVAEIEYDLILPMMSKILPPLLMIHGVNNAALGFLELVLSYHIKTRTLDILIDNLLRSLSVQIPADSSAQEEYQTFMSSPLLHPIYLNRLSVALQKFLTQSQTLPLIELTCHHLNTTWEMFYEAYRRQDADHGEGSRKRRKSTVLSEDGTGLEVLAIRYTLAARLSSVILTSLPLQSLPASMVEEVREMLLNFRDTDISRSILKSFKAAKKREGAGSWSKEIVNAAALRLLYAMGVSGTLCLQPYEDSETFGKVEQGLNTDDLLPELHLEVVRVLMLRHTYQDGGMFEDILDRVLTLVESNFSASRGRWSGQEHQLTHSEHGRINCAFAILHMLLDRWLPLLDRMASPDQLRRLLELLLSIKLDSHMEPINELQPKHLLLQTLHSAQFWEFRNVRSTLLDVLDQSTSPLASGKLQRLEPSAIMEHIRAYRILLLFPIDYFPPSNLQTLMKRALGADFTLGRVPSCQNGEVPAVLTVLRIFLRRALEQNGSIQESAEEMSKILLHLLKDTELDPECHCDVIMATLDLVTSYLGKLLKLSQKQHHAPFLRVLALFKEQRFDIALNVCAQSFLKLVDILTGEFSRQTFPEEIINALVTVHRDISGTLLPCLTSVAHNSSKKMGGSEHLAAVWYRLLRLDSWLGLERRQERKPLLVGKDLASRLLASPSHYAGNFYIYVFAIILQEFYYRPAAEQAQHLDLVVGMYVILTKASTHSVQADMDVYLGKFIHTLSPADFAHVLSFVSESLLESTRTSPSNVLSLVHLASLLLREHPSHTLIHAQKFVTSCIGVFCGHANFVRGPIELRLQTLELIAQHCSDQAALRSMDVAGIWSLLGAFLASYKTHEDVTVTLIFHKIIAILSSLIRLRRDLISHTLPHLGMILRLLLLTLRGCRPNLGGRQTTLVMNTQPQWVSSAHPLRAEEAKALARLFESLNTKTTIKVLSSTPLDTTQKAESLAKPFSKHAAYVLKAYIEAMNDPLCLLPLDVRRELQPGLFALCGMISEHSRDAMMVSSLDAGGKVTMKALWKEYEKQRYVGKG